MINFIEPYDPGWKAEFNRLKNVLESELKSFDIDIQHIGSTSIPGLSAKPILDIDIILYNKSLLFDISSRLEKIGYVDKGEQGIAGRFAFRQINDFSPTTLHKQKWQSHHLYVCYSDSLALKNHLLFRDALLQDKKLADKYAELKLSLIKEKGMTREEYTKQKTEFIIKVLKDSGVHLNELNEITHSNE